MAPDLSETPLLLRILHSAALVSPILGPFPDLASNEKLPWLRWAGLTPGSTHPRVCGILLRLAAQLGASAARATRRHFDRSGPPAGL